MRDTTRSWSQRPLPEGRKGIFTVCAGLLLVIAAALILLHAADQHHRRADRHPAAVSRPVVLAPSPATTTPVTPTTTTTSASKRKKRSGTTRKRIAAQDPQDHPGTVAAKHAAQALAGHRALQHVPYRDGAVRITLTGALRDGKAILTVTAPTLHDAKLAYRRFLARYHDAGRAYRPRFVARRKARRHG